MDDPKVKYAAALQMAKEAAALQADRGRAITKRALTLQPDGKIAATDTQITLRDWMDAAPGPQIFVKIDFRTRTWKKRAFSWATLARLVDKIEKHVAAHEEALQEEHMPGVYDRARSALADIHAAFYPLEAALRQADVEVTPEMAKAAEEFLRARDILVEHGVVKRTITTYDASGRVKAEHFEYGA